MDRNKLLVIMDERAYMDLDSAVILSVQADNESEAEFRAERDSDWPGCPLVRLGIWEVVD